MLKIDKTDLKVLHELEQDARSTRSQIAKRSKVSQQVVSYRISSLEKRNVIGGYFTIINITKLGYTSYRTMIRLSHLDRKKHAEIINYLKQQPDVLWIVDCGGRWDLLVNFMAKNIIQFNNQLRSFRKKFPEQVQNYEVLTTVEMRWYGRDYLTKRQRPIQRAPYFGRAPEIIALDMTNLKILNLIAENARMSSVDVGSILKMSANAVIQRIRQMEKSGVIQGYKPLISLEHIGYTTYKALIKFQNITEQKEKELINYLQANVNVVSLIYLIGMWDFEIEFEMETKEDMVRFSREARDKFKEIIKDFEVIPLFHEYRYNFFPGDLLDTQ